MFFIFVLFSSLLSLSSAQNDLDFWNVERPPDMANIASLEVMCGKTHMEVQISFDRPFNGIIFSKGAIDQYNCIYVKPQTGSGAYSFNIMYDQVIISWSAPPILASRNINLSFLCAVQKYFWMDTNNQQRD